MKAIKVYEHGDSSVLKYEDVAVATPEANEIRVRNKAIGLNFTDIYFRTGQYTPPGLPFIPGNEGAGEVVSIGKNVTEFKPGDRIAYLTMLGSYAEERTLSVDSAVAIPDTITYETAAASMLKGLTAYYLLHETFRVRPGDTVLIHAAAGGVGLIAVQWAKKLGATVIGTVGSLAKARLAKEYGCDYVVDYQKQDFAAEVKKLTGGKGCDVVYDGVGNATYRGSLACLKTRGMFVSYGTASGGIKDFDFSLLAQQSLFATSPVLFDYLENRHVMVHMARKLFDGIAEGSLKIPAPKRYSLSAAASAQDLLAERKTTGSTVLVP